MGIETSLTQAAFKVGKLIDACDRVSMCADFVRKHRSTDCEDVTAWVAEHDRVVLQLLEAQVAMAEVARGLK